MNEHEYYNYLIGNAPNNAASNAVQTEAAQLASLESSAPAQYQGTYQQAINNAVSNYLKEQGYYQSANDADFQTYRNEYAQGAQRAADNALSNSKVLSGGRTSESARVVASEGKNAQLENINNLQPQFKAVAANIASGENSRNADKIGVLSGLDTAEYTDAQNAQSNYLNMLGYGLNKYGVDAELNAQKNSDESAVYQARLNAAQSNLADVNDYYNNLYQYNTQSADSKAEIAESEYENNQKIAYSKAQDEYDAKVAAAKAAAKAVKTKDMPGNTQHANIVFQNMKTPDDFKNADLDNWWEDINGEVELTDEEKIFGEDGVTTYELYAKQYIDSALSNGEISSDEAEYLYRKAGLTSADSGYYNSGIADSFIKAYNLDRANDEYILNQLAVARTKNQLEPEDIDYIMKKLGVL